LKSAHRQRQVSDDPFLFSQVGQVDVQGASEECSTAMTWNTLTMAGLSSYWSSYNQRFMLNSLLSLLISDLKPGRNCPSTLTRRGPYA
jgi:hypothetical protein